VMEMYKCKYVNVFLWFVVVVRVLVPGLGW